jgi:hypothetical protein
MFESIIIRPNSGRDYPIDYGQMIENLFFYKKTIVHIEREEIRSLFDLADVDVLEKLLGHPCLSVYFNNSFTGVSNKEGIYSVSDWGLADLDIEKALYEESFAYRRDAIKSRKFSKKLSRLIKPYDLPPKFSSILNQELRNVDFRNEILKETIKIQYPELSLKFEDVRYELEYLNEREFKIHTNIEFQKTNKILIDSPILALINACEDLQVMSEYSSEISLPDYNANMLRIKVTNALEKSTKSLKEIDVFNHHLYDKSCALREAINSKRIHVKAALNVLAKADKYKHWLNDLPNDSNLLNEYWAKIQEKTVLEKLGFKSMKFYFLNTLNVILNQLPPEVAIPATVAVSAFDTFLIDLIVQKKWTPSQFINNSLRPMVKNISN